MTTPDLSTPRVMGDTDLCPVCGAQTERSAVDIGVGTQYGPAQCFECGWSDTDECADFLDYIENGAPF